MSFSVDHADVAGQVSCVFSLFCQEEGRIFLFYFLCCFVNDYITLLNKQSLSLKRFIITELRAMGLKSSRLLGCGFFGTGENRTDSLKQVGIARLSIFLQTLITSQTSIWI